jgi:hypothetical protein
MDPVRQLAAGVFCSEPLRVAEALDACAKASALEHGGASRRIN